jgi:hypothetical protein
VKIFAIFDTFWHVHLNIICVVSFDSERDLEPTHKFYLFAQEHLCFANYYYCLIWFWTRSRSSPLNWHIHTRLILKLHCITILVWLFQDISVHFAKFCDIFTLTSQNMKVIIITNFAKFRFLKFRIPLVRNFIMYPNTCLHACCMLSCHMYKKNTYIWNEMCDTVLLKGGRGALQRYRTKKRKASML